MQNAYANIVIKTTKYDEQQIDRRFYAYQRIYNVAVKRVCKLITRLERNEDYKQYLAEYKLLYAYLKVIGKKHKNLLSSQQVQSIANRVWISVEKYL